MLAEFTLRGTDPTRKLLHQLMPWLETARTFNERVKVRGCRGGGVGCAMEAAPLRLGCLLAVLSVVEQAGQSVLATLGHTRF